MANTATSGPGSVLVIQPDGDDPLDLFEDWFLSEGLTLRLVRPFAGEPVPALADGEALVVLGGDMGVHDEQAFPWLRDVMDLLSSAVHSGAPTLAICLGGQLLAAAEGGTVGRGAHGMEVGAPALSLRDGAEHDELLSGLPWPAVFASMHRDTIQKLPAGAVWLAESDLYPHQAFRIGRRAWGIQFHPEVSAERFTSWANHPEDDPETVIRIDRGIQEYASVSGAVVPTAEQLARRFAQIVMASQSLNR